MLHCFLIYYIWIYLNTLYQFVSENRFHGLKWMSHSTQSKLKEYKKINEKDPLSRPLWKLYLLFTATSMRSQISLNWQIHKNILLVYPPTPLFSRCVSLSVFFVPICSSVFFFSLCQTLATAQGNILENRELIDSLNQTKASSALIQESLLESHRLQASIDQVLYSSPYAHTSLHHFLCGMINFYKLHLSWKKWKHIYDYYIFHS